MVDIYPKKFRRRRKHTGDDINQDAESKVFMLEAARRADAGLYCKECRKRISWKKLTIRYEFYTHWVRTFFCPICSNQLREDDL